MHAPDDQPRSAAGAPERPSRWRRPVRLATALLAIYLAYAAMLFFVQGSLIFPRHHANARLAAQALKEPTPHPGRSTLWHSAPDGARVEAWFYVGRGRSADSPGPLIVCLHGNADLIDFWHPLAAAWQAKGFNVLLPEYRGYGRSTGTPTQHDLTNDTHALLTLALARPEVDQARLVYHGRSLGGGVAAQLALRHEPAALILDCTFASIADFAARYAVPRFLVRHPFRTDLVLTSIQSRVFLAHGTRDRIVPFWHSQRLKDLRPDATLIELDCDHLDFPGDQGERARYVQARDQFLRDAGLWPNSPTPNPTPNSSNSSNSPTSPTSPASPASPASRP